MRDIVTDLRTLAAMPEYDRAADMFEKCAAEIERLRAALELDRPRAAWAKAVSEQQLLMEKLEFLRICLFGAQSKARAAQPVEEDRT